ncbi:hypothetical protein SAMN05444159_1283 [Bradyrhizobium lablabi]|uniref:GIY-YIG domain-containing protein n=1 Tax=Bradyrhizobium lablabi TaxID=722472 RepID=A0A1M6LI54_9BRAD|nr:hypothetical protein [Bradyrhizobium lablabi]SHJ70870.1 hypothetical protein SAMN05444159_1283 [Bradyrhizobium lablabi]
MKLQYVNWDNFRFLTGLDKQFAHAVNDIYAIFDKEFGGEISKLMRAISSPAGEVVNLPCGDMLVQLDQETGDFSYHFQPFEGERYAAAIAQGNERYGDRQLPLVATFVLKRGDRRVLITAPLMSIVRTASDISLKYQTYSHTYVHDENGKSLPENAFSYIGVTRRGWRTRWAEHVRAAERGSRYRFHQAIRHWADRALTVHHTIVACGQTESEAMALEEQMVSLETLYPKGLNMIPGGYAGLKYLRQIGAAGANERVTPDDKQEIVNRFFESASRRGLPNPLAAANWCDPSYAEKVICAGDDRLKPDQIRNARFLASLGKSTDDIVTEIGARNKPQVQRLLAGSTYSRVA